MRSLRDIGYADWFTMIEPLVVYDPVLQQDPVNAYKFMDFDSREAYRKRVAEIAATPIARRWKWRRRR